MWVLGIQFNWSSACLKSMKPWVQSPHRLNVVVCCWNPCLWEVEMDQEPFSTIQPEHCQPGIQKTCLQKANKDKRRLNDMQWKKCLCTGKTVIAVNY